ncbi:PREDICTED: caveolin-2-like [Nanorana parkeri]|uniref:caveolin-2-like n=1 Tax=Nanorana parkeri TaxID=125878 RepID=UPI000855093E|nr:PREDICTED: caveolin-2-like [Nanorana parkeri]
MIPDQYLIECPMDTDKDEKYLQSQENATVYIEAPQRLDVRDPRGINKHLKVDFSDVLAEPNSFHSFDKVWTWSDILFESSKLWCYRIISLLCAVPVSLISGLVFAILGCIHIWCAMPCIQLCNICMPPIRTLWASLLDIFVAPVCASLGRCLSFIYVNVTKQRA